MGYFKHIFAWFLSLSHVLSVIPFLVSSHRRTHPPSTLSFWRQSNLSEHVGIKLLERNELEEAHS